MSKNVLQLCPKSTCKKQSGFLEYNWNFSIIHDFLYKRPRSDEWIQLRVSFVFLSVYLKSFFKFSYNHLW